MIREEPRPRACLHPWTPMLEHQLHSAMLIEQPYFHLAFSEAGVSLKRRLTR